MTIILTCILVSLYTLFNIGVIGDYFIVNNGAIPHTPFMQNKPNFLFAKSLQVLIFSSLRSQTLSLAKPKNKPNSKPNKANLLTVFRLQNIIKKTKRIQFHIHPNTLDAGSNPT